MRNYLTEIALNRLLCKQQIAQLRSRCANRFVVVGESCREILQCFGCFWCRSSRKTKKKREKKSLEKIHEERGRERFERERMDEVFTFENWRAIYLTFVRVPRRLTLHVEVV